MDDGVVELARQLAVFCGLVGVVLGLFGVLMCRKSPWLWHGGTAAFAALLAGCGFAAGTAGLPTSVVGPILGLAAGIVAFQVLQLQAGVWLASALVSLLRRRWVPAGTLLTACPLVALWCATQVSSSSVPLAEELAIDPARMVEVVDAHAVTDLGRRIPLYTLPEGSEELAGPNPSDVNLVRERVARLLRTATPDLAHNCHGWVFAAGQHWIKGQDVDAILEDNGYQRVAVPQAGDVIVYRSRVGSQVLHTGLVRSVAPGLILVESKWGAMGRYIHREEDQCYGDNFAYYHSGRQGHVLLGLDTTPSGSTLPATPRPRRAG